MFSGPFYLRKTNLSEPIWEGVIMETERIMEQISYCNFRLAFFEEKIETHKLLHKSEGFSLVAQNSF